MSLPAFDFSSDDGDLFDRIAAAIEQRGCAVLDGGLPTAMIDGLFGHLAAAPEQWLTRAGIGREEAHRLNRFVRSDETRWLSHDQFPDRDLLDWMERMRLGLNRRLFLGLFDYEAHYARYPCGAFYRRHRDVFADGTVSRVLSTVLYLNPDWCDGDGGEMVLYEDDGQSVLETVAPVYGRLAVFLSARFPHEVLPTRRARYSVAGWFRVNASLNGQVDPGR